MKQTQNLFNAPSKIRKVANRNGIYAGRWEPIDYDTEDDETEDTVIAIVYSVTGDELEITIGDL